MMRKSTGKGWNEVSQESVLSPLLWNVAFDSVLRMSTPANCEVVCYADDTLIIVEGENTIDIIDRVNIVVNAVARKIRWMGLHVQVAAEKTEAVRFRRKGEKRMKGKMVIIIENVKAVLKHGMIYLGLAIRDAWSIRDHLEKIASKVEIITTNLNRLMVNKKGPSEKKRRLYNTKT